MKYHKLILTALTCGLLALQTAVHSMDTQAPLIKTEDERKTATSTVSTIAPKKFRGGPLIQTTTIIKEEPQSPLISPDSPVSPSHERSSAPTHVQRSLRSSDREEDDEETAEDEGETQKAYQASSSSSTSSSSSSSSVRSLPQRAPTSTQTLTAPTETTTTTPPHHYVEHGTTPIKLDNERILQALISQFAIPLLDPPHEVISEGVESKRNSEDQERYGTLHVQAALQAGLLNYAQSKQKELHDSLSVNVLIPKEAAYARSIAEDKRFLPFVASDEEGDNHRVLVAVPEHIKIGYKKTYPFSTYKKPNNFYAKHLLFDTLTIGAGIALKLNPVTAIPAYIAYGLMTLGGYNLLGTKNIIKPLTLFLCNQQIEDYFNAPGAKEWAFRDYWCSTGLWGQWKSHQKYNKAKAQDKAYQLIPTTITQENISPEAEAALREVMSNRASKLYRVQYAHVFPSASSVSSTDMFSIDVPVANQKYFNFITKH